MASKSIQMKDAKLLKAFCKEFNLTSKKNRQSGSILISKDKTPLFKLFINQSLFEDVKSWSFNAYKNSRISECKVDVGSLADIIVDLKATNVFKSL
jgi:hypothetical protein